MKKYVEIYGAEGSATQKRVGVFSLGEHSKNIVYEGEEWLKTMLDSGIKDYLGQTGSTVFPKDGDLFLQNLKYNLKSPYLSATDVLEVIK